MPSRQPIVMRTAWSPLVPHSMFGSRGTAGDSTAASATTESVLSLTTAAGFIRRVDMRRTDANLGYLWWPEATVISWGSDADNSFNHNHRGVRQDQDYRVGLTSRFARNSSARASVRRQLERFRGVDVYKTRYSINGSFNADMRYGVSAGTNWGDQIRFIDNPFLGRTIACTLQLTVLPTSRLRVNLALDSTHCTDPRTETRAFDVKIARSFTTYHFTNRLLVRSINEYNSFQGTFGTNVLVTYRVNAGTVFFIGYADHLAKGREIDEERFLTRTLVRTNRALFAEFQDLFRCYRDHYSSVISRRVFALIGPATVCVFPDGQCT